MKQATVNEETLIGALRDARSRTLALAAELTPERQRVPHVETMNPPLWELGHVGWFSEFWTLRNVYGRDSLLAGSDALYDSAKVAHATRWSLPLPTLEATHEYLATVLDAIDERFDPADAEAAYFVRLITFHEDMHGEAALMTYNTLGYPWPSGLTPEHPHAAQPETARDIRIPADRYAIGATPNTPFVFDNEKWRHDVDLAEFTIASVPVTNAQFASFADAGGYDSRKHWSEDGWAWRVTNGAAHPRDWRPGAQGAWQHRWFGQTIALEPQAPVCNVSWFEADAYCRWAGRRLPREAEWEVAQGSIAGLGRVWEWTATPFGAYPGFVADPYKEYSEPWFGDHMVLRGGAFLTRRRLLRPTFRNFYKHHRRDVFAGFRTCAP